MPPVSFCVSLTSGLNASDRIQTPAILRFERQVYRLRIGELLKRRVQSPLGVCIQFFRLEFSIV